MKRNLGHLSPAEVDGAALLGFVDELRKQGLAASTIRNVLFTVRTFFDVVKIRKLAPLDSNPTRDPDFIKHGFPALPKRSQKAVLSKEHVEALATSRDVDEHWRVRYLLASVTGLRDGELAGLTWADLDLSAK